MKEVTAIRWGNLTQQFNTFKDTVWTADRLAPERGMQRLFAERLGLTGPYLSHLLSGPERKAIGHATARKVEKALKIESGWMDADHAVKKRDQRPSVTSADEMSAEERELVETFLVLHRKNPAATNLALMRLMRSQYEK